MNSSPVLARQDEHHFHPRDRRQDRRGRKNRQLAALCRNCLIPNFRCVGSLICNVTETCCDLCAVLFLALIACDIGTDIFWLSVLLVLFVMVMLCLTAFSNPGIIPRESVPNNASLDPAFLRLPRTKDFQINGYRVTTKYCTTCHIYRLPRCSHCAMCDNCVEKFDHYCPWVGTCIGRVSGRVIIVHE